MTTSDRPPIGPGTRTTRRLLIIGAFAGVFAVFALANAWVAARSTRPASADAGTVVRVPGADLQVTDTGPRDGPALVLLHGWTGSLHVWDRILPALGSRLRVVRVDLPGHGGSEALRDGYSVPDQARQVGRVLDVVGVRHATVAGHSMGGDVAVQIATTRPDIAARLVLIDPPTAPKYTHPSLLIRSSLWPIAGPMGHGFMPDAVERSALGITVAPGAHVPQQMVTDLNRVPWPAYSKAFFGVRDWIRHEPVPERVRGAGRPTLVVWGARDQLVSPTAAPLYRGLPHTRVVVLPRIGHTPPVEAPRATAALLREFANHR